MAVKIITKDTFEETINCGKTVLVDFSPHGVAPAKCSALFWKSFRTSFPKTR